ncbi:MAG TPA: hypothetical protein VFZ24_00085 [Longimicrobiales bacterium]
MHDAPERPHSDPQRRDRRDYHGRLLPALLVSAFVHAILFFAFSFSIELEPRTASLPPLPLVRITPAMQAYDLREVAGEVEPIEVQIRERAEVRPPPRTAAIPIRPEAAEPVETVDPLSVRDRLRYRMTTPQVWRAPSEDLAVEMSDEERVHQRIAAQLAEYNDSVAAEAAMRERASDWTVKDADGNRWGVSPGFIHLGSISIPVGDSYLAAAPGRREEFAGRVRTWDEIQIQAARVDANESFKSRVKAIEERKAQERAEQKKKEGVVTSSEPNRSGSSGKPPGGNR